MKTECASRSKPCRNASRCVEGSILNSAKGFPPIGVSRCQLPDVDPGKRAAFLYPLRQTREEGVRNPLTQSSQAWIPMFNFQFPPVCSPLAIGFDSPPNQRSPKIPHGPRVSSLCRCAMCIVTSWKIPSQVDSESNDMSPSCPIFSQFWVRVRTPQGMR